MPSLLNRWCYFHNSETCRNTQFVLAEVQKFVGVGGGCHFFFFFYSPSEIKVIIKKVIGHFLALPHTVARIKNIFIKVI